MLKQIIGATVALVASASMALGCTAMNIAAKDGGVVAARTMEWAADMKWALVNIPKGSPVEMAAPADLKLPSKTVKTAHAILGITTELVDGNALLDGTNAAGLTMSANFLPGFTTYQDVSANDKQYVSIYEFGTWALGMFARVPELRDGLADVKVWWDGQKIGGTPPDLHFVFTDKTGESIIVEFVDGEKSIHKNEVGVLTNAPTYEWHLTNLRNYLDLRSVAVSSVNIGTTNVTALGQGGGLLGIPADYTPPSRFVRTTYLRYFATEPKNTAEAVSVAGHILNTVDIPHGVVRSEEGGQIVTDYTQWVVIKDLSNDRMMIADYNNRTNFLTIDLESVLAQKKSVRMPVADLPYPSGTPLKTLTAN